MKVGIPMAEVHREDRHDAIQGEIIGAAPSVSNFRHSRARISGFVVQDEFGALDKQLSVQGPVSAERQGSASLHRGRKTSRRIREVLTLVNGFRKRWFYEWYNFSAFIDLRVSRT